MEKPLNPPVNKFLFSSLSHSAWLTLFYLALGISWILLSDRFAYSFSHGNNDLLRQIQQMKGLLFVSVSSLLIYLMSARFYGSLKKSFQRYKGLEKTYHALNEATREGVFDCDLETMSANLNSKMQFFVPGSSLSIKDFWTVIRKRIAPNNVSRLLKEFGEVSRSTKTSWQTEFNLLGNDNLYYTVLCSIHIIRDKDSGKALRIIGAVQDLSDLRNLQAQYYNEQINHRQTLAKSIIEAQENEKNRWAEELHDNVCQLLSVAKMNLTAIPGMPEVAEKLRVDAKDLVMKSIDEIRELSANIKPPILEDYLITESIGMLTANIARTKNIRFNLISRDLDESKLSDAHRILIYRVIQEQLTNIVKYANATEVDIDLRNEDDKCKIVIRDDGDGFEPGEVKTGIGLKNIASRLQLYRGKMIIHSSPGNGCTMEAMFRIERNLNMPGMSKGM